MAKIPLIIMGAAGKMGQTLLAVAKENPSFELCGLMEHPASPAVGKTFAGLEVQTDIKKFIGRACAIVDFSKAGAVAQIKDLAQGSVYVMGTTALEKADQTALENLSQTIPVIASENMSFGIALLTNFIRQTAETLDESWDIEIHETHHRRKKDAPSGTALLLGRAAAKGRGKNLGDLASYDPNKERKQGAIGFSSTRGGDVVGTHQVSFMFGKEVISFSHEAFSRDIFAYGALRACQWGWGKAAGLYSMQDVLGTA